MSFTGPIQQCFLEHLPSPFTSAGGLLHHFTDDVALTSIVSSGEIWMTRYDRMCNDHREGGYILELYDRALQNPGLRSTVPKGFLEAVSEPRIDYSVIPLERRGVRADTVPYVLCLSTNIDDGCMRDYYKVTGRGGWLQLTGKISQFGNCGSNINNHFDKCMLLGFLGIRYDEGNIVNELTAMVEAFYETGKDDPESVCDCIGECLSRLSLSVKAPYDDNGKQTCQEHEVRLVYYVPTEDSTEMFEGMSEYRQVDPYHMALPLAKTSEESCLLPFVYSRFPETVDRLRDCGSKTFIIQPLVTDGGDCM